MHIQFHNVCYLIDIDLICIIIDLIIRKYTPSASTILIIYLSLVFLLLCQAKRLQARSSFKTTHWADPFCKSSQRRQSIPKLLDTLTTIQHEACLHWAKVLSVEKNRLTDKACNFWGTLVMLDLIQKCSRWVSVKFEWNGIALPNWVERGSVGQGSYGNLRNSKQRAAH